MVVPPKYSEARSSSKKSLSPKESIFQKHFVKLIYLNFLSFYLLHILLHILQSQQVSTRVGAGRKGGLAKMETPLLFSTINLVESLCLTGLAELP